MTLKSLESFLKFAVFAILAVMGATQLYAQKGLFADGSFHLLDLLMIEQGDAVPWRGPLGGGFWSEITTTNNEPSRFLLDTALSLPPILALRAGVTNMNLLIYLYTLPDVLAPLLFWGAALWKTRKEFLFWPILSMFSVVYFDTNAMTVAEYNTAFAMAAYSLVMLIRPQRDGAAGYALLFVAAFLSIMSFASSMFIGPLLAFLALRKFMQEPAPRMKAYWALIALLFAASGGVGLWGYLAPHNRENLAFASRMLWMKYDIHFWAALGFAALAAANLLIRPETGRRVTALLLTAFAVVFLTGCFTASPQMAYNIRAYTAALLFVLMVATGGLYLYGARIGLTLRGLPRFDPLTQFGMPVFALFCALSLLDMQDSFGFRHYIDAYRAEVNSHTGLLRYEDSIALLHDNNLYGWPWTFPTLGLLLRKNAQGAIVTDPWFQKGRWHPFDPVNGPVPDLSRYYNAS